MPDLRYDPMNHLWVAIAGNRSKRPNEFSVIDKDRPLGTCPFCGGHEEETPPELEKYHFNDLTESDLQLIQDDSAQLFSSASENTNPFQWINRTIPNRYPAFGPMANESKYVLPANESSEEKLSTDLTRADLDSFATTSKVQKFGPYQASDGEGSCQYLIIESPRHITGYADLNDTETVAAFLAYKNSLAQLEKKPGVQHAMLFKNCRPAAGASLAHVHTQLVGMNFVPQQIGQKKRRIDEYPSGSEGKGLIDDLLEFELKSKERVVFEDQDWVVLCPFASRFPFQTWILPKTYTDPYWNIETEAFLRMGFLVRAAIRAFDTATHRAAYNVLYHLPPFDKNGKQAHLRGHSFTEIFARSNGPAGFEWGTNCWINPVSPEQAAEQLRIHWQG